MATAWRLSLGYNSGYGSSDTAPWEALLEAVQSVTYIELLSMYQGPLYEGRIEEAVFSTDLARNMTTDQGIDGAVTILEEEQMVILMASGGGVLRKMKEYMRRAFVICVLKRAQGFDINVTIT